MVVLPINYFEQEYKMEKYLFTSESVTKGHPDKICDQISYAILDEIIMQDPNCRVACETTVTTDTIIIIGEITRNGGMDLLEIARRVVEEIGYINPGCGFDYKTCKITTLIDKQSIDIESGVSRSIECRNGSNIEEDMNGAGDQCMMFGYACDETPELMPMPISLAHKMAMKLSEIRKFGELGYLRPDGKTQVAVEYIDDIPARIDTVIVSAQHSNTADLRLLHADIIRKVILPVIPENMIEGNINIYINPTGRFVVGGPHGDSGLTGRKIIVDTYGGYSRHGGVAFSDKDSSKVDRSSGYAARHVAKNIVAAGLAKKCEIQIAYAIGIARPVSVMIDTFRTGKHPDSKIAKAVKQIFDLRSAVIIKDFDLRKPIYQKLASYGHMGREDLGVKWEKTDKVDELTQYFNNV